MISIVVDDCAEIIARKQYQGTGGNSKRKRGFTLKKFSDKLLAECEVVLTKYVESEPGRKWLSGKDVYKKNGVVQGVVSLETLVQNHGLDDQKQIMSKGKDGGTILKSFMYGVKVDEATQSIIMETNHGLIPSRRKEFLTLLFDKLRQMKYDFVEDWIDDIIDETKLLQLYHQTQQKWKNTTTMTTTTAGAESATTTTAILTQNYLCQLLIASTSDLAAQNQLIQLTSNLPVLMIQLLNLAYTNPTLFRPLWPVYTSAAINNPNLLHIMMQYHQQHQQSSVSQPQQERHLQPPPHQPTPQVPVAVAAAAAGRSSSASNPLTAEDNIHHAGQVRQVAEVAAGRTTEGNILNIDKDDKDGQEPRSTAAVSTATSTTVPPPFPSRDACSRIPSSQNVNSPLQAVNLNVASKDPLLPSPTSKKIFMKNKIDDTTESPPAKKSKISPLQSPASASTKTTTAIESRVVPEKCLSSLEFPTMANSPKVATSRRNQLKQEKVRSTSLTEASSSKFLPANGYNTRNHFNSVLFTSTRDTVREGGANVHIREGETRINFPPLQSLASAKDIKIESPQATKKSP